MSPAKPAVVGAFVLSGLGLAVGAILLFGSTHLFRRTVPAVTYFQGSVGGLDVGAPVTFRGVRVGSVTGIAVNLNLKDLTARIPVSLELNPSLVAFDNGTGGGTEGRLDRMIQAGLQAQLIMQSLITGQLQVELDLAPGNEVTTVRGDPDRPEIPSIPSKLQRLEDEIAELPLKEIAESARQTLDSIQHLAAEVSAHVGPLADSLKGTSDAAHATLDELDRLAVDGRHQLKTNGDELGKVLVSSDRTVHEAETLLASLKEMTAPNSQIRGDLQATIRDLAASASALRGFTHEIERDPSAILSGRTAH